MDTAANLEEKAMTAVEKKEEMGFLPAQTRGLMSRTKEWNVPPIAKKVVTVQNSVANLATAVRRGQRPMNAVERTGEKPHLPASVRFLTC